MVPLAARLREFWNADLTEEIVNFFGVHDGCYEQGETDSPNCEYFV
jgi:hypothetical protein